MIQLSDQWMLLVVGVCLGHEGILRKGQPLSDHMTFFLTASFIIYDHTLADVMMSLHGFGAARGLQYLDT